MKETSLRRVLLVEDDDSDIIFFERALRTLGAKLDLTIARDGEEAVQALSKGSVPPDCVLLDLKMPRRSGIEVLSWIRSRPDLKSLSVIVMTSSGEPSDLARIQELGIDEYIVKPVSYEALLGIVGALCETWGVPTNGGASSRP